MRTRVLIAALVVGALLCSGIVGAEVPPKETIREAKFVHYLGDKYPVKVKTLAADAKVSPARVKTPRPTVTATPTPAPGENPTPAVTAAPTSTPTATPTPVESDLYQFTGKRWTQVPVQYCVGPAVAGLSADAVTREVSASLDAWDAETGSDLFAYAGTTEAAAYNNGRSEVYWTGNITDTRIIAKTLIRYSTTAGLLEADIQLNSNLPWGIDTDGEGTSYTLTDQFDVRNIVTHEAGHAIGLADLYETSATDLTMFGYSSQGQVKKDSLGYGDILGIRALYGA